MLICCDMFDSLVIQWRFVNRIQKQMTAFKEVFYLILYHKVNIEHTIKHNEIFLCLGIL